MARTVTAPLLLPKSQVMLSRVLLPDLDRPTLIHAFDQVFPFPPGALSWGFQSSECKNGFHDVWLAAVPRERAMGLRRRTEEEGARFGGLGIIPFPGAETLWIVPPPPPRSVFSFIEANKRIVLAAALFLTLVSMGVAQANKTAVKRLRSVEMELKRFHSVNGSRPRFPSPPLLTVFSHVAEKIPLDVGLLELDLDSGQRSLFIRARTPHYAGVSNTVAKIGDVPEVAHTRANKAQLLKIGDRSLVEFSIEGAIR